VPLTQFKQASSCVVHSSLDDLMQSKQASISSSHGRDSSGSSGSG